jgi:hypothetical protein
VLLQHLTDQGIFQMFEQTIAQYHCLASNASFVGLSPCKILPIASISVLSHSFSDIDVILGEEIRDSMKTQMKLDDAFTKIKALDTCKESIPNEYLSLMVFVVCNVMNLFLCKWRLY